MRLDPFAQALLDPDMAAPGHLVGPDGQPSARRFAVYRNNVTVSLVEALRATFPSVLALLGADYFAHVARAFARRFPPEGPVLAEYGERFPQFLSRVPLLASRRFVPEVARLDWLWLRAYHAADAVPLAAERAEAEQSFAPERHLALHPATRLLVSRHPVVDLFKAARQGRNDAGIDPSLGQAALVLRPQFEVRVVSISPAATALLTHLLADRPVGEACAASRALDADFDCDVALCKLADAGAFADESQSKGGDNV
jgi:hypothetical protein